MDFSEWMKNVDEELNSMTGKTSKDFPSKYKQKYNKGLSPLSAAIDALNENNYFLTQHYNPEEKYGNIVH